MKKYAFDEYRFACPGLTLLSAPTLLGNLGVLPSDSGTHCKPLARCRLIVHQSDSLNYDFSLNGLIYKGMLDFCYHSMASNVTDQVC